MPLIKYISYQYLIEIAKIDIHYITTLSFFVTRSLKTFATWLVTNLRKIKTPSMLKVKAEYILWSIKINYEWKHVTYNYTSNQKSERHYSHVVLGY